MNDYIGLCRLSASLDSLPASYNLISLLPFCLIVTFSKVHRPRGSFDIDYSFWVLCYKVDAALFFLSFDSRSYTKTTHPPSPVVPENTYSVSPSYMSHANGRYILFTDCELSPWPFPATTATLFLWAGGWSRFGLFVSYLLVPNVATDCSFQQCFQKWFVIPHLVHTLLFHRRSRTSLGMVSWALSQSVSTTSFLSVAVFSFDYSFLRGTLGFPI